MPYYRAKTLVEGQARKIEIIWRALELACKDLANPNRQVIYGGSAEDYKKYYLKESEKQ